MFKVQEQVFYPKYGVGVIIDIQVVTDSESSYQTYQIEMLASKSRVSLPVDDAKKLGLRKISNDKEIQKALDFFAQPSTAEELSFQENWKDRKKDLEDMFYLGDVLTTAKLIKILYYKHQKKQLGAGERKLYDLSLLYLVDELSLVKKIDTITAEHLIAIELIQFLKTIEIQP